MNHHDVAHRWANRTHEQGKGCNVFFEGNTIYSYGHHFPIARHHKDVVLFTTKSYSTSTSKHISYTRGACSHLKVFMVQNVNAVSIEDHKENVNDMLKRVAEIQGQASRARKYGPMLTNQANGLADSAREYGKLFIPRFRMPDLSKLREHAKKEHKKALVLEKKQKAQRIEREKEKLEDWKTGTGYGYRYFHNSDIALRLHANGDDVETSQGARVPLQDALRLFALCESCREKKHAMDRFSHKVGYYTPTSIDEEGNAVVGCHKLSFNEMSRVRELITI